MQEIVAEIFDVLGGATAIHRGTGRPVQTVHDWLMKGKPEIPPWRRAEVLEMVNREGKAGQLSPAALEYLSSETRTVGRAA